MNTMPVNGSARVDPLYGRKVAVLGFARQGKALARWLPTVGARVLVSDTRSEEKLGAEMADFPDVEFVLGGHPDSLLDDVDVLCLSGGVSPDLPIAREAVRRGIRLTNDAQFFLERCAAPVIGITGSAGKTTTTTLTGEIMKRAGHTVWVGGNIGDVLLDVLSEIQPDHRVVMELSSFQLELMTVSPATAAILNITPNHLDRHGSMEAYAQAKARIMLHQSPGDVVVLSYDNPVTRELGTLASSEPLWFSAADMIADGAFLAGQRLLVAGRASLDHETHVVCERADISLRGEHNVLNVLAACALTGASGVAVDSMAETIRRFQSVAHRLEIVRVREGVTYINDSIATAPERVVAALRSFTEPIVLLAGGKDKKLPWDDMLRLALAKCRHIVAFGDARDLVVEGVRRLGGDPDDLTRVDSLEDAVMVAAQEARPGDVVLLSPGGTSYDAYVDFAERGEHYRQLVMRL